MLFDWYICNTLYDEIKFLIPPNKNESPRQVRGFFIFALLLTHHCHNSKHQKTAENKENIRNLILDTFNDYTKTTLKIRFGVAL